MKACIFTLKTFVNKASLWDEYEKAYFKRKFIFRVIYSRSEAKMKHHYTMEEVMKNINK